MVELGPSCDLRDLLAHPNVAANNQRFLDKLSSNSHAPGDFPSLCVMQGEVAVLSGAQLNLLIGSQDATTCLVAILACPHTRIAWVAHLDYPELGAEDARDLSAALQQMQQPQLFMVGGYCDDRGQGPRTVQGFLQLLHSLDPHIQLQLCCVGHANTAPDGSPRCCQLVLDMHSWQPHPWLFADRGPEVPRRFAAQHCRQNPGRLLLPIWDQQQQQLVLPPFDCVISSWQAMRYERLLAMPDQQLLQYMSTSPKHEPHWFTQDMRTMLQWLLAAQEPASSERKAANATQRYCLSSSGTWQLLQLHADAAVSAAVGAAVGAVSPTAS